MAVHIHAGTTCTESALGHYYTGTVTSDPWTTVSYTALADGTAARAQKYTVTTGATSSEVMGRAFIVHDYKGARIACAILGAVSMRSPPTSNSLSTGLLVAIIEMTIVEDAFDLI